MKHATGSLVHLQAFLAAVSICAGGCSQTRGKQAALGEPAMAVATSRQALGSAGLVAAYNFDEGSGLYAADSSGNLNDGTLLEEMWSSSGKHGGAAAFDGTGQWITVAPSASLDLTTAMTLEAWVRPAPTMDIFACAFIKESDTDLSYALYASDNTGQGGEDGRPFAWINTDGELQPVFADTALTPETWTHLAATYDNATLTLYINGAAVSSVATPGPITTSTGALHIGGSTHWGGEYYAGLIDDVRIYNRVLTTAEIAEDMATPAGESGSDACIGVTVDDGNACTADACDPVTGNVSHTPVATGAACNDGNACTQTDTCQAGACVGSNPKTCAAQDQCHSAGTCDPSTGICPNPTKPNGTACNDGSLCTTSDSCQSGTCIGSNPVTCVALDQCHVAGACDAATGTCSNPAKADGMPCNDANACTSADVCQAGTCAGSNTITCPSADQCHGDGACDPSSGACSVGPVLAGTPCGPNSVCGADGTCRQTTTNEPPPLDNTVTTDIADAVRFLYTGASPIQQGTDPTVFERARVALIRGKVVGRDGAPLAGAAVRIGGEPRYGQTTTLVDGSYSLVVNGGSSLRVVISSPGYLGVERRINPDDKSYRALDDIVLTPLDASATTVSLPASAPQLASGSLQQDADGSRRAEVLFESGTSAVMTKTDGTSTPLPALTVRATEYTVGSDGMNALPAELPPSSGYMYAVELSVDEATAAGAEHVVFDRPVALYVDNFLGLPVGEDVPMGNFDHRRGVWVPQENGRVIRVLDTSAGEAEIDIDNDGESNSDADLAALGITLEEREVLASTRSPGESIWRFRLRHFSTLTCALGGRPAECGDGGPCQDDLAPDAPHIDHSDSDCNTVAAGSVIECESQVVRETLPVVGTPFTLNYRSALMPGFTADRTLLVPLVADKIRSKLLGATATVEIAGRRLFAGVAGDQLRPFETAEITWDGRDAFGRRVNGAQRAHVTVKHIYSLNYARTNQRFGGLPTGPNVLGDRQTGDFRLKWEFDVELGGMNAVQREFGGWTLNRHHFYDAATRTLYSGTGERVGAEQLGMTVAHATSYRDWSSIEDFTFAANGDLYFQTPPSLKIWRLNPTGTSFPIAFAYAGVSGVREEDGIPATSAWGYAIQMAFGPDGSLYLAEGQGSRVRRVDPDGRIRPVAGKLCPHFDGGQPDTCPGYEGDGGPATAARLNDPRGVAVAPDGRVFIADTMNHRIRVVDPDGIITTFAGNGLTVPRADRTQDGLRATEAAIPAPDHLHLGPDGSLYCSLFDKAEVVRITPDGILRYVGGPIPGGNSRPEIHEGVPAYKEPSIAQSFDVDRNGSVFVLDSMPFEGDGAGFPMATRIRMVSPGGLVRTLAGGALTTTRGTDLGQPALRSNLYLSKFFGLTPAGEPVSWGSAAKSDSGQSELTFLRVTKIEPPSFPGCAVVVPAPDGSETYCFDETGRHLSTQQSRTGATLETFEYTDGLVSAIVDSSGNRATFDRDLANGRLTIRGAYGDATVLTLDSQSGFLAALQDPDGAVTAVNHQTDGLLTSMTDSEGRHREFAYDEDGRLTEDLDPAGARQVLTRTGTTVVRKSGAGRSTSYDLSKTPANSRRTTVVGPDGATTTTERKPDLSTHIVLPDRSQIDRVLAPDPNLGMVSPFVQTEIVKLPSGLTRAVSRTRTSTSNSAGRVASLTEAVDINGAVTNYTYTDSGNGSPARSVTSAAGRQVAAMFDNTGRIRKVTLPGIVPVDFAYDSKGRLLRVSQGERFSSLTYSSSNDSTNGYVSGISDALGAVANWTVNGRGLAERVTVGADTVDLSSDLHGNVLTQTSADRPAHVITYTPVDLIQSYTPPNVTGESATTTLWQYNLDRQLLQRGRSALLDDSRTYDAAGRLEAISGPNGATTFAYYPNPCSSAGCAAASLQSVTGFDGTRVNFVYDGILVTGMNYSGPTTASISRSYYSNFNLKSEAIGSSSVGPIDYELDGTIRCVPYDNLTCATSNLDSLRTMHDAGNGLLTGITAGSTSETLTYDEYGGLAVQGITLTGTPVMAFEYASSTSPRDLRGRVAKRIETGASGANSAAYEYDALGQLKRVTRNGQIAAEYEYDKNGNRLSLTTPLSTITASYDPRDRLTAYGDAVYTNSPNGERLTRTVGGQTTSYTYDNGSLLQVDLPGGARVRYVLDGFGHRVGKRINGTLTKRWLYNAEGQLVAELDVNGMLVSRFIYASRANLPDLVVRYASSGGVTVYRVVADQLGSPHLLVNIRNLADQPYHATYDEFGRVSGSGLDLIPFGFAAGQYDPETGLVHFGAREYDPETGRWTSKDATLFEGGDSNLYVYAGNDPVNFVDPTGTIVIAPIIAGFVFGAGLDIALQLIQNGGNFGCIDYGSALVAGGLGALGGTLGVLGKGVRGFEFSHFIPRRYTGLGLPSSIINSSLNGNYVPAWFHAATDAFRFRFVPAAAKASIPRLPPGLAQVARLPGWLGGGTIGAAATNSECNCR